MSDNDDDYMSEKYIAGLLDKESRKGSIAFSDIGLPSFAERKTPNPLKLNKRFLKNVLRSTDAHNSALLAKEQQESREKQYELDHGHRRDQNNEKSKERTEHSSHSKRDSHHRSRHRSRPPQNDERKSSRRKYRHRELSSDVDTTNDRPSHHHRPKRFRTSDHDRDRGRKGDSRQGHERHRSYSRSQSHGRRSKNTRHRSPSRSSSPDRRHEHHAHRNPTRYRDLDRHRGHERSPRLSRSPDRERKSERKRRRSYSRSRSPDRRSRRHQPRMNSRDVSLESHTRRRKDENSSRYPTPSPIRRSSRSLSRFRRLHYLRLHPDLENRSLRYEQEAEHPTSAQQEESLPKRRDSTASNSSEISIGPLPADVTPKATIKGRGAFRDSGIDARFDKAYEPSKDVTVNQGEIDQWDLALAAARDRQKWAAQKAEALKSAGHSHHDASREKDVAEMRWAKKGEGREWDRGKVLDSRGEVELRPEWGRLKDT